MPASAAGERRKARSHLMTNPADGSSGARDTPVSRETSERARRSPAQLTPLAGGQEPRRARRRCDQIWDRHIVDSLQLLDLAPEATPLARPRLGAGFPGLVLAIAGAERGLSVHLVESNSRKCAFLRQIARLTGAPATSTKRGWKTVVPGFVGKADVVSARASPR